MQSKAYKLIEFFIIFILFPVSYTLSYSIYLKLFLGVIGFAYVIYVLLKVEKMKFKINPELNWKAFFKTIAYRLSFIAIFTILFVWITDKDSLFKVLLNKPLLWVGILFFYSFFSVYPQELIYRTFYFQRYYKLFNNKVVFILLNAIMFSLAHLFFKNKLVLIITFLGGILFALTYKKTKSTLLVTIEHAIYGCWLFTVGMGEMLGFPS